MVREGGRVEARDLGSRARDRGAADCKSAGAGLATLASASATVEELYLLIAPHARARLEQHRSPPAPGGFPRPGRAIRRRRASACSHRGHRQARCAAGRRRRTCAAKRRCSRIACARPRERGAKVAFVNPARFDYLFPVAAYLESAAGEAGRRPRGRLCGRARWRGGAGAPGRRWCASAQGQRRASRHRRGAQVRSEARHLAGRAGAASSGLSPICARWPRVSRPPPARRSARSPKAAMPRARISPAPCRIATPAASRRATAGKNAREMLAAAAEGLSAVRRRRALGRRHWTSRRCKHAAAARSSSSPPRRLRTRRCKSVAHVLLPIGTFAETSGTYVNLEGLWQSFAGAAKPLGEARPGWKVLRVLGNLLRSADFDYQSSEEVREELRARCGGRRGRVLPGHAPAGAVEDAAAGDCASSTCHVPGGRRAAPRAVAAAHARRQHAPSRSTEARAHELPAAATGRRCPSCGACPPAWILVVTVALILSRRVHHAVGAQGHRLDAAAPRARTAWQHLRLAARHLSAVRRRHQAADQGSRSSRRSRTRCCSGSRR